MEAKEPFTLDLKRGVETNINNPNPMNWDVEIETAAGSVIAFTVPAGGTFRLKPIDDLKRVTITCGELVPFGPRPLDPER